MPGTDGPRQFPCSQTRRHPLVRAGPRHLYMGPEPECGAAGVQIVGGTFLSPPSHTHPHSFREPKCSLSRHISFVSRENYANARFYTRELGADCQVGWAGGIGSGDSFGESPRVEAGEHLGDLTPDASARRPFSISLS